MNVAFRVDSSTQIGIGHQMRCLALADRLRERGANVLFICRELPGNRIDIIERNGHKVHRLPYSQGLKAIGGGIPHPLWLGVPWAVDVAQVTEILAETGERIDWLVVDNYALDKKWESRMRPYVEKIMVIDDLADRAHDCDILLDQNYFKNPAFRYFGLVPHNCKMLLGPRYALLRSEFREARRRLRRRNGIVKSILIFFGGSDPTNETSKAINAFRMLGRSDIEVKVVIGSANQHINEIKDLCACMSNAELLQDIGNMAEIMAGADLAIGAGGIATWERCCLGLPSLIIAVADNQEAIALEVDKYGAGIYLGKSKTLISDDIVIALERLIDNPSKLANMSYKMADLVDGNGAIYTSDALLSFN